MSDEEETGPSLAADGEASEDPGQEEQAEQLTPASVSQSGEASEEPATLDQARGADHTTVAGSSEASRPPGTDPASELASEAGPDQQPPIDSDPYRAAWFFDNPSLGRAIRYTFAEKRLARAVFVNALLLVMMLAGIQEVFGKVQLGLYHEKISYGRLAFLGIVVVEAVIISLLAPLGFINLFEAERREECFDQVVTTGVTPHRVVFGRFLATLAFTSVVLLSSLPFLMTAVVLDGASLVDVLHTYVVLLAYSVALCSLVAAVSVGLDDTALPIVIALVAVLVTIAAGFSRRSPPEFAAFSPIRYLVVEFNDIIQGMRLGTFASPEPFGVEVPCTLVSLAYYGVLTFLGLAYAYVGPDLELSRGLDSFDSVATSRNAEATQARRGVARTLLRTVQLRFFYENISARAKAISPLLRALTTMVIFGAAHVFFLSAFWPESLPTTGPANRTLYAYLGFCFASLALLAISGAGARSSLLARRPVALGPLKLGRFVVLFLLFGFALAVPPGLWAAACEFTHFPLEVMSPPRVMGLYALVAGYTAFIFAISLLMSMLTTNPYSATGWTFVILFATNLTPAVWLPLFTGNMAGIGTSFLLDLSPFVAAYAIARPGDPFNLERYEGIKEMTYEHMPGWEPFAIFVGVIGVACLIAGILLARRELRDGREAAAT